MTTEDLARSYLTKAKKRLKVLDLLLNEEDYSDVIRESRRSLSFAQKECYDLLELNHQNFMMLVFFS